MAHENIRRHWARTDCQPIPTNCDDFQGANARYLPATTVSDRLTLFAGTPDQIDRGSALEFGRTLEKAINGIPDVDTIIAGHWNTPLQWSDFVEYRAFYTDLVDQARRGIDAGRSADEVIAAYVTPDRYQGYMVSPQYVQTIVRYIYAGT